MNGRLIVDVDGVVVAAVTGVVVAVNGVVVDALPQQHLPVTTKGVSF